MGAKPEQSIPASASVACALIGILLLDDDPRGEFHEIGQAQTVNLDSAFLSAASQAILQSEAAPSAKLHALESINQMIVTVAFGQYLDVQNPADEAAYWRVVNTKSTPFVRSAFELGALLGGAPIEIVREIGKVGHLYGGMIQVCDDMDDCMAEPANPDWTQGRFPLPILFAQSVNHSDRDRFVTLRSGSLILRRCMKRRRSGSAAVQSAIVLTNCCISITRRVACWVASTLSIRISWRLYWGGSLLQFGNYWMQQEQD